MELAQEEQRALANEREFDDRRAKQREKIETLSREIEVLKRDNRHTNDVNDHRIAELEDRVRQLTQQHELNNRALVADGQILASRANDGFVVIDRGHQHNLRKGTKFLVFNRRGGRHVIKGAIEVVDVEARMSQARVLAENDGNDPLVPGDYLHNPVYNPNTVLTFVIRGEFRMFSKDELTRFISEAGGRVSDTLSTNSDFLVAGEKSDKALDEASRLGISVLSEDQLVDFMRYQPKFSVHQGMTFVLAGKFTDVSSGNIKDFITRNGGEIRSSVDTDVSVLVAGEGAVEEISKARMLGITIVDQSQFANLSGAGQ
jgi:NAD-dependent DNA ligase